ncbi:MAG TPA: hypothetical protein VMH81_39525 [Bryobacteraceae bacterium]|nr:hypothetical protein [Bryobacteraceae bacterium]
MQSAVQVIVYLTGFVLELLAIAGMLRGPYRRYPFIFVYIIADFLTTVIEMKFDISAYLGNKAAEPYLVTYYWIDEVILQVLVYSAVISLLYFATSTLRSRRILRLCVICFALLFAGISFVIYYRPRTIAVGEWMTPWSSNLNFCSAILDLALWALLIASREKDQRLLMLSGALGIQFTGEAIGHALRNLSRRNHSTLMVSLGNAVAVLTYLAFLYILWQTFRPSRAKNLSGMRDVKKT